MNTALYIQCWLKKAADHGHDLPIQLYGLEGLSAEVS